MAAPDPGKFVQAWLPTALWKRLRDRAEDDGISLSTAVYEAIVAWLDRP